MSAATDWSVFRSWKPPASSHLAEDPWRSILAWTEKARADVGVLEARLSELRSKWRRRLEKLGGDPGDSNWTSFRPLRLSREEDWSDWLAHLLQESRTGEFARRLLDPTSDPASFTRLAVLRECSTEDGGWRADLVLEGAGSRFHHIEVKVGDQAFTKTFETSRGLRRKFKTARAWSDFIVLPESSLYEWEECAAAADCEIAVEPILWSSVAISLRRCLWRGVEPVAWRAWALAFCGAVEQTLLGVGHALSRFAPVVVRMEQAMGAIFILEQGMSDE